VTRAPLPERRFAAPRTPRGETAPLGEAGRREAPYRRRRPLRKWWDFSGITPKSVRCTAF